MYTRAKILVSTSHGGWCVLCLFSLQAELGMWESGFLCFASEAKHEDPGGADDKTQEKRRLVVFMCVRVCVLVRVCLCEWMCMVLRFLFKGHELVC